MNAHNAETGTGVPHNGRPWPPPLIARWIAGQAVKTDELVYELRFWADLMDPPHSDK